MLGLAIGFAFFKHQARKVDEYSYRIAYMQGRLDQAQDGTTVNEVLVTACNIYNTHHYADIVPYGYTIGPSDRQLKELCQNQ